VRSSPSYGSCWKAIRSSADPCIAFLCELPKLPYEDYRDSNNIVARLNLPNLSYPLERKVEVYARAVRGLLTLEPRPERQLKYLDFIDIYAGLDDKELEQYRQEYPEDAEQISTAAERFRQEGKRQGEAAVLLRLMECKFKDVPEEARQRVKEADPQTLLEWSARILMADTIDAVFH